MTTTTIESSLAELAELRHRLAVEGQNGTLAASIRERVEALPSDAPEVCRAFGTEVLKSIAPTQRSPSPAVNFEPGELPRPGEEATAIGPEGVEGKGTPSNGRGFSAGLLAGSSLKPLYVREMQAIAALGIRLPLRASAVSMPGHVTPLPETHGLVHGGIVQARGFRLVVKAYRFFQFKRESTSSYRHVEVLAGVCDRFNDSGALVSTWSTAERLGSFYASTSVVLPAPPCVQISGGTQGFYRPAHMSLWFLGAAHKPPIDPDDGIPDPLFYTGKVLKDGKSSGYTLTGYRQSPPPALSLENALFIAGPQSSSGFVIDTPYVSVFSLGPDSPAVIVTLPRVFRDATLGDKGAVSRFERKERWEVKLFSAGS